MWKMVDLSVHRPRHPAGAPPTYLSAQERKEAAAAIHIQRITRGRATRKRTESFRGNRRREARASSTRISGDPAAGDTAADDSMAGNTVAEIITAMEDGLDANANGVKAGVGSPHGNETTAVLAVKESGQGEAPRAAQDNDREQEDEKAKGVQGEGRVSHGREQEGAATAEKGKIDGGPVGVVARTEAASRIQVRKGMACGDMFQGMPKPR